MPDFDEFLKVLRGNMEDLARKSWKGYREAAVKDGESFLRKAKDDLKRWTMLLAEGKLTQEDFVWLVQGKKDLAVLEALKQEGLSLVQLDRFRNALLDVVVNTAIGVYL